MQEAIFGPHHQQLRCFVALVVLLQVITGCSSSSLFRNGGEVITATPEAAVDAALARRQFVRGVEAWQSGEHAEATAHFSAATDSAPDSARSWLALGIARAVTGHWVDAEVALNRSVALAPRQCAALVELGVVQRHLGKFEAAQASYKACLKREPKHALALRNLGILYELYLGRPEEALSTYLSASVAAADTKPAFVATGTAGSADVGGGDAPVAMLDGSADLQQWIEHLQHRDLSKLGAATMAAGQ